METKPWGDYKVRNKRSGTVGYVIDRYNRMPDGTPMLHVRMGYYKTADWLESNTDRIND